MNHEPVEMHAYIEQRDSMMDIIDSLWIELQRVRDTVRAHERRLNDLEVKQWPK